MSRVVVGISEQGEGTTVALLTANAGLDAGREVVLWATGDAVEAFTAGGADGLAVQGAAPATELLEKFAAAGGEAYVCPVCFKARGLDEGSLLASASLKGAAALMDFTADGAVTFSY